MSTTYYHRLRQPFTSITATNTGAHVRIGLWVNHAKAGEITVRNDEYTRVIMAISDEVPESELTDEDRKSEKFLVIKDTCSFCLIIDSNDLVSK